MNEPIRVLVVEDRPPDAELMLRELRRAGYEPEWKRVETESDYLAELGNGWEIVLSDYKLPQFNGLRAVELLKARGPDIPIIIVSGTVGEETAVEALKAGANDYLMKDRPARLGSAVQRELRDAAERRARRLAESALRESERRLRDITSSLGEWVWEVDENGVYTYSSPSGIEMFGETIGKTPFDFMTPDEGRRIGAIFSDIAARRAPITDLENWNITKSGDRVCLLTNGVATFDEEGRYTGYRGVDRDITGRKQAEAEKARLEVQLQQAQKMESVGRLAGGVAHDFNNMLGVILGHAELALGQVDPAQPLYADLEEIRAAAARSAALTRQLLAFARKQTVSPRVLDLNEMVAGMVTMLRRLIGEDIDLQWRPGADLWLVNIDPSQTDQILANLCVNARDAIAGVGTLTVGTGNSMLDEHYCAMHAGCVPGQYVRLEVSDNGCGMDEETLAHAFEPFFTTKESGKGTGLGLATVYGAVKQNHGYIDLVSKPGRGTTFTIYLPRYAGVSESAPIDGAARPLLHGQETILLVEDERSILTLTQRMLEYWGYTVLAAGTPREALRLARAHTGEIGLLITDVIMPEMDGQALAMNLAARHPGLKRLFMSGYTGDVIANHGVLDEGAHFIQKPFSTADLAAKVRMALETPN
ncbi:MAG: response regulator [Acidobacteria bacterium]|nr:response regulator [Acidobacteriota bacterium]